MAETDLKHAKVTRAIIDAFFAVYNSLGHGFLEARYAAALERELRNSGRHVAREYSTRVYYDGVEIGYHRLDMVVDLVVVVEIKSAPVLLPYARRQLHNYLRATNLEVGLLLYFGPKPKFERLYIPNDPVNRPTVPAIPAPWDAQAIDNLIDLERQLREQELEEGWRFDDEEPPSDDDPLAGSPS
jgi:GxxExxY protein